MDIEKDFMKKSKEIQLLIEQETEVKIKTLFQQKENEIKEKENKIADLEKKVSFNLFQRLELKVGKVKKSR